MIPNNPRPFTSRHIQALQRMEKMVQNISVAGASTYMDSQGIRINANPETKGFWTRLGRPDPLRPGQYEHVEQTLVNPLPNGWRNADPGIRSTTVGVLGDAYSPGYIRNPAVEINQRANIGLDENGNQIVNSQGSVVPVYVWVRQAPIIDTDVRGDTQFLFEWPNSTQSPAHVYFRLEADADLGISFETEATFLGFFPAGAREPETHFGSNGLDDQISVTDVAGFFPRALKGAYGLAIENNNWGGNQPRYDIILCQQKCLLATAYIDEPNGMDGSIGYVTVKSFEPSTFSLYNQAPDPRPTQVLNMFAHMGKNEDPVALMWDEFSEEYVIIDVMKHKFNILVQDTGEQAAAMLRVKADGKTLEGKIVESAIEIAVAPQYGDVIVGTKCDQT